MEYLIKRDVGTGDDGEDIDVSRFFIQSAAIMIEKEGEGSVKPEGTYTPEAIYGLVKYGFCEEKFWPHDENLYNIQPSKKAFREARKWTVVPVLIPPHLDSMKRCLNDNLPFIIGLNIKLLFLPDMIRLNRSYNEYPLQRRPLTGHVVLVVGYNDFTQLFIVRNSWGEYWVSL